MVTTRLVARSPSWKDRYVPSFGAAPAASSASMTNVPSAAARELRAAHHQWRDGRPIGSKFVEVREPGPSLKLPDGRVVSQSLAPALSGNGQASARQILALGPDHLAGRNVLPATGSFLPWLSTPSESSAIPRLDSCLPAFLDQSGR